MLGWFRRAGAAGRSERDLETEPGDDLAAALSRNQEAHDALRAALLELMRARLTEEDQDRMAGGDKGETR